MKENDAIQAETSLIIKNNQSDSQNNSPTSHFVESISKVKFFQEQKVQCLLDDLENKIRNILAQNKDQSLKSFLNYFENLAMQYIKSNFKEYLDFNIDADRFLVHILKQIIDQSLIK